MNLSARLSAALGTTVKDLSPCSGGDINEAYRARLADGSHVFVKHHPDAPPGMFAAEAKGLAFLADAKALRVPTVRLASDEFLVLDWVEPGRPAKDHDERLGRGLATLHRHAPSGFGLDHDNFIGRLPQKNAPAPDWPTFYRDRRLQPQYELARRRSYFTAREDGLVERLFAELAELVGPAEPPARLHGDLWGGNAIVDESGAPCLIDPAVYGGHREVDLAMMRLFGGFSPRVFAAYAEAYPLSPGHADRVPLYQLYYLLVHVNLFGGVYVDSVAAALARLV